MVTLVHVLATLAKLFKMHYSKKIIKLILAILFLICLLDMPYGYYELTRFLALMGFGYLSIKAFQSSDNNTALLYLSLAILFQPLFKIALGRFIWSIIDVIVACGLIISIFKSNK